MPVKQITVRFWILFLMIFASSVRGRSQESGALFLVPGISQSSELNPAFRNKTDQLVIGLPLISSTGFSWNTNFPLNALFSRGLWNYNFADFYNNLQPLGEGQASARSTMFFGSLNYGEFTFSISVAERAFATTSFNRDIVQLIRDGTEPWFGKTENFGKGTFNYNHFRELAFGISQRYWKELDIGIRPKILFGKMYFDAKDVNFSVDTDQSSATMMLKPEGSFVMSAPLTYEYDSIYNYVNFSANAGPGDYSFNLHNLGFALDLGAVFRPNKFYEITASVLDLGFNDFKHNTFDIEFKRPILYRERTFYQSYDPAVEGYIEPREALKIFTDSVSYVINVTDKTKRSYNLMPFKINISGKYNISETFSAGLNNQFSFYRKHSVNMFSGFVHKKFNEKAALGTSLTTFNLSSVMLGLGFSYTAEHVQYYLATENIFGIIQTAGSKHLNLSFGINFLFNTVRK